MYQDETKHIDYTSLHPDNPVLSITHSLGDLMDGS